MKPTDSELTTATKSFVKLDVNGKVTNEQNAIDALCFRYDVTPARASKAVESAARSLRHAQLAEDGAKDYITFRIRLSKSQHERAVMLAKQETGGNVSALFRLRTLG